MPGLVLWLGLGDLFESQGHRECSVNQCQAWCFGWDWVICLNLKVTDNVLLISDRSGLLGGMG